MQNEMNSAPPDTGKATEYGCAMIERQDTSGVAEPLDLGRGYRLAARGRQEAEDDRLGLLKAEKKEPDQSKHKDLIALLDRIQHEAQSSNPSERLSPEETQYVTLTRNVMRKKGKWNRFGPDVK
jgi:hypothetical protein